MTTFGFWGYPVVLQTHMAGGFKLLCGDVYRLVVVIEYLPCLKKGY
jgi:hypothetical protein